MKKKMKGPAVQTLRPRRSSTGRGRGPAWGPAWFLSSYRQKLSQRGQLFRAFSSTGGPSSGVLLKGEDKNHNDNKNYPNENMSKMLKVLQQKRYLLPQEYLQVGT